MILCFITKKKITKSISYIIIFLCFNIFDILIVNFHFRLFNGKSWMDHLNYQKKNGDGNVKMIFCCYNDRHENSSWIFAKSGEVLVLINTDL